MPTQNTLLGEIETEIRELHKAKVQPGDQVNLERDANTIRVENAFHEPVGCLPKKMVSWLAPLVDGGQIFLDGYLPEIAKTDDETPDRCPVVLRVFQREKGRHLLEKAEPHTELEALHQTILQAYQDAQSYRRPELVLGLAKRLRALEKQELLPETRLLLGLLPRIAHEVRASQGVRAQVKFHELLRTLTIGEPSHHHNLTFFPLLWPNNGHEPPYTLLSTAIEAGQAVVEEVTEAGSVPNLAVTNKAKQPILIPEGEILMGAKQNRVINITVLVAAGVKFVLPVSCVEAGRWQYRSRHFESKYYAPVSLRNKKLKSVHKNRSERGLVASDQGEVWDEVQACLSGVNVQSQTASLTDAFAAAEETLKEHCKRLVLPEGAAGVLVGRNDRIIGMDLFDSPTTLKTLWSRLSDAYLFDALRDPAAAPATTAEHAQQFIERLGSSAEPRIPALALGEELEIAGKGLVGAALLYNGSICHLAAFSDGDGLEKEQLEFLP